MGWADRVKKSLMGVVEEDAREPERLAVAPAPAETTAAPQELVAELLEKLVKISKGKLKGNAVDTAGHIFDYGYVDSLSAVMFIAHIERHYGVKISDVEIVERYNTLDAIAARIQTLR